MKFKYSQPIFYTIIGSQAALCSDMMLHYIFMGTHVSAAVELLAVGVHKHKV